MRDTNTIIRELLRVESARLVARIARIVRDVGLAEEITQDAFVAALEHWPNTGIPGQPGAWLMAAAQRRAIDALRRKQTATRRQHELSVQLDGQGNDVTDLDTALDDDIGDELLSLLFASCHPVLSTEARVTLTLRLFGGLTTDEIARAFLTSEQTIAQRIVRAKRTLAESRVEIAVPRGDELGERLPSVLEVVYLIFNEGYAATRGADLLRPDLCVEALRLGQQLARLAPQAAETHALLALMELQASRTAARFADGGEPIPLLEQDRSLWDQRLIDEGTAALARAAELAERAGPYQLQAEIAACHSTQEDTNWAQIAALYGQLAKLQPSPVVEVNRAVAVSMASGPSAGLAVIDRVRSEPALRSYALLPAVRGDLLFKLCRFDEAAEEFEQAARLTHNQRERDGWLARADFCREPKS
ncbi:MAG TPA: sigma-70 family RNA polymerase sigma factor [Polyangiales bacterium]|nr:sigma-70 family RNA polymerase sigma factor [Polyangiales bacterium]